MRGIFSCEHDGCFVIHEPSNCPLCDAKRDIADLEDELAARLKEIDTLKDRITELEADWREAGLGG